MRRPTDLWTLKVSRFRFLLFDKIQAKLFGHFSFSSSFAFVFVFLCFCVFSFCFDLFLSFLLTVVL